MTRLTVCLPEGAARWAAALSERLPGWQISAWQPGDAPADYALLWKPPSVFFAEQTQLRAAFAAGAGVDALLDLKPPATLPLYRLEDAGMGAQMAEYVLATLLRWYRELDRYAAQAAQGEWLPRPPQRKADWPVGLLGCGVLAQPVVAALRQLGFPVQAWARAPRADLGLTVHTGEDGLQTLLRASRVLVLLLPLTPATRGLLDARRLALLPPGACLINLARGALIDESALLQALNSGHLAAAALDVCATEPAEPTHPFWRHPRVQLTPHVAAATLRDEALTQIADKLRALARGERVSGRVGADGY